ncbi:MAG TPA: hypothetical protein VG323_11570, partial [Thermoanaerobaculia bacterium]|nr:hypothetical protein [Thermoanaerobaculia bacterium]
MSIEPTPHRTLIHLDNHTLELPPLQEPAAAMLASLTTMPSSDDEIDRSLSTSGARTEVYYALHLLNRWHLVSRRVESSGAGATLRLMAGAEAVPPRITLEGCALRLSRFAYARRRGDELVVESPLAHAMLHLRDAELAPVLALLAARAATADDIAASVGMPRTTAAGTLALLAVGGFMAGGEDDNSTLRQWDFHDFLFHSRCRLGRHDNALGGNFRFKGTLEPQPAIKTTPRGTPI